MKISGKIKRKKAVILTPEKVASLCDIILKHSERLEFSAETYAKTSITFDNMNELLEYDNFKPRRITAIEISGYIGYSRIISAEIGNSNFSPIVNYGSTIRCDYQLPAVDEETIFKSDFETWYQTVKSEYWLLGKFSFTGLVFVPSIFITLVRLISGAELGIDLSSGLVWGALVIVTAIAACLVHVLNLLDVHLLGNLFPAVAFLWGEEQKRNEQWGRFRSNLLWGIIIALLLGLVTNYLYDTLKGL